MEPCKISARHHFLRQTLGRVAVFAATPSPIVSHGGAIQTMYVTEAEAFANFKFSIHILAAWQPGRLHVFSTLCKRII